jgi:glucan biosynthesis protein
LRIIYLFGAGASLLASLLGIGKMTEDFFTNIIHSNKSLSEIEEHLREKVKVLEKITKESFDRFDLETFITLIVDLANNEYKAIFQKNYPDLENISKEDLQNIKLKASLDIIEKYKSAELGLTKHINELRGTILSV